MKRIKLTQNKYALVDKRFHVRILTLGPWHAVKFRKVFYVASSQHGYLHRLVWKLVYGKTPQQLDHINRNGLDCRISNLRPATYEQNQHNRSLQSNNKSGYKGVSWYKRSRKWQAKIVVNRKQLHLGYYNNKRKAAIAYNEAAIKYHGKFAVLNQPKDSVCQQP